MVRHAVAHAGAARAPWLCSGGSRHDARGGGPAAAVRAAHRRQRRGAARADGSGAASRASAWTSTIRQLELSAFLARVYGPGHDFEAAVLGVSGDPGLAYLRSIGTVAGVAAPGGPGRGAANGGGLGADGRALSCARTAGNESAGAGSPHGSSGGAADGARLVGRRRDDGISGGRAGAARLRRRMDRRAAVLGPRGWSGGLRRDRASRARRGASRRQPASADAGGSRRDARAAPTRPRLDPSGPLSLLQAGSGCCRSAPAR